MESAASPSAKAAVRYPELVEVFEHQNAQAFIADGEIVAFKDGVTSFSRRQIRMQVARPSPALRREVPVWFYLFDLLYIERYDIRRVPLRYRKRLLRRAFDFGGTLCFTKHREKEGERFYREACRRGWEGIVAKDETSEYVSKRTRDWLKFQCTREQEFVIVSVTPLCRASP
jgi:ATP-dependent DNA ligase